MTPVFAALVALACTIGGALAGMLLRARLPEHHFDADSKDVVKLVMGLIATISALVLGLLIASAQSAFSQQGSDLQKVAADLIQLDRLLGMYGAETRESRDLLRQGVVAIHRQTWTEGGIRTEKLEASVHSTGFFNVLQKLAPATDTQRFIQAQVFQLSADIDKMKLLMFERAHGSISWPFLVVLVLWISTLFLGFGLFAPLHTTIVAAFLVGALSVSAAIFLILELSQPYSGVITLSDEPFRDALAHIGRSGQ